MNESTRNERISSDILVLLRPNGTVLGGTGLPSTWLERRLEDLPLPSNVTDACRSLRDEPLAGGAAFRHVHAEIDGLSRSVSLVVIDALPMRRALVPVRPLLFETLERFAMQAKNANVELALRMDDDLPAALHGDSEKLAWVLATLVGNAVRLAGGVIEGRSDAARVCISAGFDRMLRAFVFVIEDNGPGMPEPMRRWLFECDPNTGRSAGVALRMVRDIMAAHDGTIEVESITGSGSRFTLCIPKARSRT